MYLKKTADVKREDKQPHFLRKTATFSDDPSVFCEGDGIPWDTRVVLLEERVVRRTKLFRVDDQGGKVGWLKECYITNVDEYMEEVQSTEGVPASDIDSDNLCGQPIF